MLTWMFDGDGIFWHDINAGGGSAAVADDATDQADEAGTEETDAGQEREPLALSDKTKGYLQKLGLEVEEVEALGSEAVDIIERFGQFGAGAMQKVYDLEEAHKKDAATAAKQQSTTRAKGSDKTDPLLRDLNLITEDGKINSERARELDVAARSADSMRRRLEVASKNGAISAELAELISSQDVDDFDAGMRLAKLAEADKNTAKKSAEDELLSGLARTSGVGAGKTPPPGAKGATQAQGRGLPRGVNGKEGQTPSIIERARQGFAQTTNPTRR